MEETLKGWVTSFYVRYGTKKLGPYYARTWKQNGKLKREYIKFEELEEVKAACQRHRERRQQLAKITRTYSQVAANLNFLFRMLKRSKRRKPRTDENHHLALLESQGLQVTTAPPIRRRRRRWNTQRSVALPGDVSAPQPRVTIKFGLKSPFMYPSSTKHSRRPMNPFFKHQIPSSEPQAPSSHKVLEKLADLKAQPADSASQKKLTEIKTPFPDPPKIVRFYFCRANEGDPMPSIEETEWEASNEEPRRPDETNTIYEYYRSVQPARPKADSKDGEAETWKPPCSD